MGNLVSAIGGLVFMALMASLAIDLVTGEFPDIDAIGWIVVLCIYGAIVGLTILTEPLLMRAGWKWSSRSEDVRMTVLILLFGATSALVIYLLWPVVGAQIAPHFGNHAPYR